MKSKRPASQVSADDLCVIGIAVQHQERGEESELLSISYHIRYLGESHSGILNLDGANGPPKLTNVVGDILQSAKLAGVFNKYPTELFLVVHGTALFLESLKDHDGRESDFNEIKSSPVSLSAPAAVSFSDRHGNNRHVSVWLVDTKLLGPDRETISECSEWLGNDNPGLPDTGKWGAVAGRQQFKDQAILAAQITADVAVEVAAFTGKLIGDYTIPLTIGSLAEKFVVQQMEKEGIDLDEVFGYVKVPQRIRGKKKTARKLQERLHLHQTIAAECYQGGRNESFFFGPSDHAQWRDDDLASANPTVVASMGQGLWDMLFSSTDLSDFEGDILGMAWVDFTFPPEVRFPVVPVRVAGDKLILPLSGSGYATAPELSLARRLGASIKIKEGRVIPMDMNKRPFEKVIGELLRIRNSPSFTVLEGKLAKKIANSIYGKMGQGLPKRWSAPEGYNEIPTCTLTQPFLAAHVTGMVRAIVGEILNNLPPEVTVLSVTTDGFVSDATEAQLAEATRGELCSKFADARERITGDKQILKTKRRANRLFCGRNRVMATLETAPGNGPILTRSGIQTPTDKKTRQDKNNWLIDQFFERAPETPLQQRSFNDGKNVVKVHLDYDFDRKPVRPEESTFKGRSHISFKTEPWDCKEDYEAADDALARFQKDRCLKTPEDLEDLMEMIEAKQSATRNPNVKGTTTIEGPVDVARREFLRALRKGNCGLEGAMTGLTLEQAAEKINAVVKASPLAGKIVITVNHLKNAQRPANPVVVPRTGRAVAFMELMKTVFPEFDPEELLEGGKNK